MTTLLVLLASLTLHEVAHAWAASCLGDPTPRRHGRLTLNPMAHLDTFGALLPAGMALVRAPVLVGWARPVPLDPLRLGRGGLALTLAAGPAANAALAGIAALLPGEIAVQIVAVNASLCAFNLLPIKPLDGWWLARMAYLRLQLALREETR